jgi:bifunctional DNase/RNase
MGPIHEGGNMFKQMKVSGLVMDPQTNTPILILKDVRGEASLPIWIGILEATSIATELEKIQLPRPMTHDLIKNCFDFLNVKVERIEVCDLRDNTYYALIYLRANDQVRSIDARPSDAVAIALRTDAPIYVKEEVLSKSQDLAPAAQPVFSKEDKDKLENILENLDPEAFGKYKM